MSARVHAYVSSHIVQNTAVRVKDKFEEKKLKNLIV